jgi:hypothetical protein
MFWGTFLAAAASPLLLVGWAADRLQSWLNFEMITADALPAAPVLATTMRGMLALALGSAAALACGIAVLLVGLVFVGAWNIADVAAAVRGAALCGGWYLFAGLAAAGGAALLAAGWAAQHYMAMLVCVAAWLVARPALDLLIVVVEFLTRPLSRRLAAWRGARFARRDARRLEGPCWKCPRCGYRNHTAWDWCHCGAGRPVGAARRLWRWTVGRTVGGRARAAGGLGIVWIWLKAIAKGTCPLVEFLTPDELRALSKRPRSSRIRSA